MAYLRSLSMVRCIDCINRGFEVEATVEFLSDDPKGLPPYGPLCRRCGEHRVRQEQDRVETRLAARRKEQR